MTGTTSEHDFLPGLPVELIRAAYAAAPGREIESGKFSHPESSAALVANAFGFFLDQPAILPALPGTADFGWPAHSVNLEVTVRFPWTGGRHPCLDVLIVTGSAVIGIESKRYEPFRSKSVGELSDAYRRPVWGHLMSGYQRIRNDLGDGKNPFDRLDAAQLVKHAFGLRTALHNDGRFLNRLPILFYLYAEPKCWPDGRAILSENTGRHRADIAKFQNMVLGDEVRFLSCSYGDLLATWEANINTAVNAHASAVEKQFAV